jgi:hypothetical protein
VNSGANPIGGKIARTLHRGVRCGVVAALRLRQRQESTVCQRTCTEDHLGTVGRLHGVGRIDLQAVQAAQVRALRTRTGPLRNVLDRVRPWRPGAARCAFRPIRRLPLSANEDSAPCVLNKHLLFNRGRRL